jgi:hypothetical protein
VNDKDLQDDEGHAVKLLVQGATPKTAENLLARYGFEGRRAKHGMLWKHPSGVRVGSPNRTGGSGGARRLGVKNTKEINEAILKTMTFLPEFLDRVGGTAVAVDADTGVVGVVTGGLPGLEPMRIRSLALDSDQTEHERKMEEAPVGRRKKKAQSTPPAAPAPAPAAAPAAPQLSPLDKLLADAKAEYRLALECMTDVKLDAKIDTATASVEALTRQVREREAELARLRGLRTSSRDECRAAASQAVKDVRALCTLLRIDYPEELPPVPTSRDVGVLSPEWRAALPKRVYSITVDRMRILRDLATCPEPFTPEDLTAHGMPTQGATTIIRYAEKAGLIKIAGRIEDARGRETRLTWTGA